MNHGGNKKELSIKYNLAPEDILDFSASINPLGPPEWLPSLLNRHLHEVECYPEPHCESFINLLSKTLQIDSQRIIAASGANQIFYAICKISQLSRALIALPSYTEYVNCALAAGLEVKKIYPRDDSPWMDYHRLSSEIQDNDLVFLGHPNNPNGNLLQKNMTLNWIDSHPNSLFVIDESFLDFIPDSSSFLNSKSSNVIVVRSFTKFYAIPGLRIGYSVSSLEHSAQMRQQIPDWSVNIFAQKTAESILLYDLQDYRQKTIHDNIQNRKILCENLGSIPLLETWEGMANFILCRLKDKGKWGVVELSNQLMSKYGISIRDCQNMGLEDDSYFRVAVLDAQENQILYEALKKELSSNESFLQKSSDLPLNLSSPQKRRLKERKSIVAKRNHLLHHTRKRSRKNQISSLMIQGTSSNSGKSILTAAFCRIFSQDGMRVSPFKAQNMSLNSFVTKDGREIAHSQVLQAAAARIEPDYRFNPILLKPISNSSSQIIVEGKSIGKMSAREYQEKKKHFFEIVCNSYDELSSKYDLIVLEGAGSPAEINLKKNDIVNMNMALYADSPVLLVGDIDRGGVFASFTGTYELVNLKEKKLIKGFLVNRFRGDSSLLQDAYEYMKFRTGKSILGTIPYIENLNLPEEDSLSFQQNPRTTSPSFADFVDIALIEIPHIANVTDITPLLSEPDVKLRCVREEHELGEPDAIIIPGSRNSIEDLRFLQNNGLGKAIQQIGIKGKCEIVGICAGFQMLGSRINDPHGIEAKVTQIKGLSLLDLETEFFSEKQLTQMNLQHIPSNLRIKGYEIHHGKSKSSSGKAIFAEDVQHGASLRGLAHNHKPIWGGYIHGIFDDDLFRRWFIDGLRERKGMQKLGNPQTIYDWNPSLNRLADIVRDNVDMKKIYRLLAL